MFDADATNFVTYYFDTLASSGRFTATATYPTWPNPATFSTSSSNRSIYATYTASGGGSPSTAITSDLILFE